ncbi:Wzz/FepE/Etk N-terminal domain-containing protein [Pelodictyon luteolum]|uniref:Lipopolysaccharide biosynthesis protein n=1 Tax=Chlorobium luteolum (strain DSM 273 / BCRC 81028 / 2530) TaxID=319225 RepID=Q3B1P5_CHLL3|nr:Wzz/FepE/Etk N-terminal domain-containing protein [Pelodictyon luteolum]ABB24736.1 conserved hypothetical protein [Pelodictyon luteolum DSM 273]
MAESILPAQSRQPAMQDGYEDEISLLDLAITLAKYKKLIIGAPFAVAVIVSIYTLFQPNIYTADTRILPPQQQSSASAMLSQLGALGGLGGSSLGIKNPNDTYVAMLESRPLQNNMIKRFKLQDVYKAETLADAREALGDATTVTTGKDGLITIAVDDQDPKRAAVLANGYTEELQKLTQVFAVTDASQRRIFFEKQLNLAKEGLADAEVSLKQLQQRTGVLQLDAQAGQLMGTGQAPDIALRYIRKVRDLKYAETLYEILAKQYEMAKLDESKESTVIQVLEKAVVPEDKSKPQRSKIVLIAALAAGFLAVLYAFVAEALQKAKEDKEQEAQLDALKANLRW